MTTAALLRLMVPRDWTAVEALAAVRLVRLAERAITDAIWAVHGEAMAAELVASMPPPEPVPASDLEDEIPF